MRPNGRASKTSSIATRIRFAAVFSNTISLMQNNTPISARQISLFGETVSTFSLEASPASRSARQANDEVRRTIAISGRRCCERFGKSDPAGSWAKMFSESLVGRKDWYSSRCALIWKLKVTASSRTYFQLAVSMRRTGDTEHGSSLVLPTVQTQGLKICRNGRMEPLPLNLLPTPTVSDATIGSVISSKDRYVATSTGIWRKIDERGANWSLGLSRMSLLHLLPEPEANGYTRPLDGTEAYRIGTTSRLNPLFVEEMMGFPNGWILLPFLRDSTIDRADAAAM